jgi:hypothetical protein
MATCIFCQTDSSLTIEHAIPQWMAAFRPPTAHVLVEGEQRGLRKWRFTSDKVDLKVRGVCANCNSGWMSALENNCRPLLTELLYGRENRLSRGDQRLLCAWAIKTVMVMEFLGASARTPYFTARERRQFMETLEPPSGTCVFLAGYVGQHAFWGSEHPIVFKDADGTFSGYSVTMGFGGGVIQTLSYRAASGPRWFKVTANFDSASFEIWPRQSESVVWPPEEVFDDEGLRGFAKRWLVEETLK